jgi:hypothetical protein
MSLDGNIIPGRLTKKEDVMVKQSISTIMEVFTLDNTRMVTKQKGKSMSCKKIKLTHFTKSNMRMDMKLKKEKSAEDIS